MATNAQRISAECKYLERIYRELVPQEFLADKGLFSRSKLMTDIVLRAPEDPFLIGFKKVLLYDRILKEANTASPLLLNGTLPNSNTEALTEKEKMELEKISSQVLHTPKARNWLIFYVTIQQAIIEVVRHYIPPTQGPAGPPYSCLRSFGAWLEIMRNSAIDMKKRSLTRPLDLTQGSDEWWIFHGHLIFGKLTKTFGPDQRTQMLADARQIARDHHADIIALSMFVNN